MLTLNYYDILYLHNVTNVCNNFVTFYDVTNSLSLLSQYIKQIIINLTYK